MFVALSTFVRWDPMLRTFRIFERLRRPDPTYFRELFRVGWPVGVTHGLESGLFTVTALMIGSLSTVALAAHQIALQSAAFTFMVPLGIGVATSVRVGQAVGRGDEPGAQRAGFVGILLGLTFMSISAVIFRVVPEAVVGLYLDLSDPSTGDVTRLAAILLGVAGVFQVFDGIQVSAAGALRGLKDTRMPMLIGFVSYWVIGLSTGYLFGFVLGRGAEGLWWGLVVGLASAAMMLSLRFRLLSSRISAPSSGVEAHPTVPAATAEY
jgi:MATE family multidrug resistance protein